MPCRFFILAMERPIFVAKDQRKIPDGHWNKPLNTYMWYSCKDFKFIFMLSGSSSDELSCKQSAARIIGGYWLFLWPKHPFVCFFNCSATGNLTRIPLSVVTGNGNKLAWSIVLLITSRISLLMWLVQEDSQLQIDGMSVYFVSCVAWEEGIRPAHQPVLRD